jgi:hypothetical protein
MSTEAAAGDLEYGAVADALLNSERRPAGACRAEQVAVSIGDQARLNPAPLVPLKLTRVVGVPA